MLLLLWGLAAGCQSGQIADPNDVASAGADTPAVIQAQLDNAAASLNDRKANKEIDQRQYDLLIAQIARDYLAQARDTKLTGENAWQWGDIYITAREWPQAEAALTFAMKADSGPAKENYLSLGRLMTDKLRLARVEAELGKVHVAVALVRQVFSVPPKAKAPILPAVLYEIVPAGQGKGSDLELAQLLEDSIEQHQSVLVDPSTNAGRDFLLARPHHILKAWEVAAFLYEKAGRPDLAAAAATNAHRMSEQSVRV